MKYDERACKFIMDTGCVELLLRDGRKISIDCTGIEDALDVTMAQQLLFFNTKVRILAQKRLRDRLKIYLQTLTPDEKGCYSLPYTRTELADFLCVDRSALSRELCRMRDEGILDFSGAKIHLLNPTFLYGWN